MKKKAVNKFSGLKAMVRKIEDKDRAAIFIRLDNKGYVGVNFAGDVVEVAGLVALLNVRLTQAVFEEKGFI